MVFLQKHIKPQENSFPEFNSGKSKPHIVTFRVKNEEDRFLRAFSY